MRHRDLRPDGIPTCAGQLPLGEEFVHAGILGTTFTGRLLRTTQVGGYTAVLPEISGRAWITAITTFVLDSSDPFPEGYVVGDIWGDG